MKRDFIRKPFLITGVAGFIGFHLCRRLLAEGAARVVGLDNMHGDDTLKRERLDLLRAEENFHFSATDITDDSAVQQLFAAELPATVAHFAARTGVRDSLSAAAEYANTNITGFVNVLEACRKNPPQHLLYASSGSVYGDLAGADETADLPPPLGVYSATKIANEHLAGIYARCFGIAATGLRFFTVYGPWGRRDMAVFIFAEQLDKGERVQLANNGDNIRSFTCIDDVINAVMHLAPLPPAESRVLNVGCGDSLNVRDMLALLEKITGGKAVIRHTRAHPADAHKAVADCRMLKSITGFAPAVSPEAGLRKFIKWHRQWRRKK